MTGFEPAAPWPPARCATKLRYIPEPDRSARAVLLSAARRLACVELTLGFPEQADCLFFHEVGARCPLDTVFTVGRTRGADKGKARLGLPGDGKLAR